MSASMPDAMGAAALTALMAEEGPIVNVVILHPDGTVSEKSVDMSPKANSMVEILGGSASILGQWPQIDVVVLRLRSPGDAPSNSHKLQPPMHEEGEQKGTLVCVRMDEDSNPQNFTKAEYEEFAKRTFDPADFAPGAADDDDEDDEEEYDVQDDDEEDDAGDGEGDEGDDDDDEGEDEDEDDDGAVGSDEEEAAGIAVLQQIVSQFVEVHGREPSQEELKDVLRQITAAANAAGSDGEDEEEDAEEEEGGAAASAVGGSKRAREGGDDAESSSPNKKPAADDK